MDIGLEEVEQAASLVQQAVHPDALTIFGATFDETLDDEIRVTVIATGFDKKKDGNEPAAAQDEPARTSAPLPMDFDEEKKAAEEAAKQAEEDDPFADIFKIFNRDK
jgi:cell division protein FtsZ